MLTKTLKSVKDLKAEFSHIEYETAGGLILSFRNMPAIIPQMSEGFGKQINVEAGEEDSDFYDVFYHRYDRRWFW